MAEAVAEGWRLDELIEGTQVEVLLIDDDFPASTDVYPHGVRHPINAPFSNSRQSEPRGGSEVQAGIKNYRVSIKILPYH